MKRILFALLAALFISTTHAQVTTTPAANPAASGPANITSGTISGAAITAVDTNFSLLDDGDNTKAIKFNASGVTTGVTRTYTLPDADGALLYSGGPGGAPSSLTLTNATGLPVAGGGTAATTARGAAANLAVNHLLCKSFVQVAAPANTAENTLYTCSVPANAMGANGAVRVTFFTVTTSDAGTAKTIKVYFGGTGGTDYTTGGYGITAQANNRFVTVIGNRNATNSQYGMTEVGAVAGIYSAIRTPTTSARDTTATQDVTVTCTKSLGSDTCALNGIIVELLSSGA